MNFRDEASKFGYNSCYVFLGYTDVVLQITTRLSDQLPA